MAETGLQGSGIDAFIRKWMGAYTGMSAAQIAACC
jgi:hypothetical protein